MHKPIYLVLIILLGWILVSCDIPPDPSEPIIIPDIEPSSSVSATDFQGRVMRFSYPNPWLARVGSSGEITMANRQNALGAWDVDIFSLRHGEMAGIIAAIDAESISNSWERNLDSVMSTSRSQLTRYQDVKAQFKGNEPFAINERDGLITDGTLTLEEKVVEVIIIVVYDEEDGGFASMLFGAPVGQILLYEPTLLKIAGTFDFIRENEG